MTKGSGVRHAASQVEMLHECVFMERDSAPEAHSRSTQRRCFWYEVGLNSSLGAGSVAHADLHRTIRNTRLSMPSCKSKDGA